MPLLLLAILALVQGVTEFLPISSSAHLVLTRWVWAGPAPDDASMLALDVALHVGTLGAVMLYFRQDVAALVRGGFALLGGKREGEAKLAWLVIVATLPAVLVGFLLKSTIEGHMRGVEVIAWTTLIFGALLWLADRAPTHRKTLDLGWKGALAVGVAQAFALVPGVSRSGVTMTAARWLGLKREEAARFALLLSMPTIAGAGLLAAVDLEASAFAAVAKDAAIGGALAFAAAYGAILLMMRWLRHASFTPFVIYRVALGLLLLWFVYA